MKTCAKCGETKPLDEYHRNKNSRDGRVTMCKSCVKAYQAEWRERPEVQAHMAEYRSEHYRRNRDAIRAQQAEHSARPDVKARKAEYSAEYRRQNRDAILAREAEYYAANRETILERMAEYRAARPHQRWVYGYQHRARKYGYPVVIEPFTKDELIARWGDTCWHCGGPFEELDHHPIPVALGGHHTLENCRPSCLTCNRAGTNVRRTNETENTK